MHIVRATCIYTPVSVSLLESGRLGKTQNRLGFGSCGKTANSTRPLVGYAYRYPTTKLLNSLGTSDLVNSTCLAESLLNRPRSRACHFAGWAQNNVFSQNRTPKVKSSQVKSSQVKSHYTHTLHTLHTLHTTHTLHQSWQHDYQFSFFCIAFLVGILLWRRYNNRQLLLQKCLLYPINK